MPTSPQWGYLKVRDPQSIPLGKRCCKNDKWNEYVLFLNPEAQKCEEVVKYYKRQVTFKMVTAKISSKYFRKRKISVALVDETICSLPPGKCK